MWVSSMVPHSPKAEAAQKTKISSRKKPLSSVELKNNELIIRQTNLAFNLIQNMSYAFWWWYSHFFRIIPDRFSWIGMGRGGLLSSSGSNHIFNLWNWCLVTEELLDIEGMESKIVLSDPGWLDNVWTNIIIGSNL